MSRKHCIGPVIRGLRVAHGIGLNQMADELEIEAANLSRFERTCSGGLRMPDALFPIAEYLGTSVPVLFMLQKMSWDDPKLLTRYARLMSITTRLDRVVAEAVDG